ncbi:hypothetical protein [Amycolatopsis coloradensis]|uniref:hypothetical protein n=1 Tax=Amycolatopsis coloradensis TaxID=76021 RepID=UPI001177D7B9|nr:hypothetical protein [Amycolatopsis coloradensis]
MTDSEDRFDGRIAEVFRDGRLEGYLQVVVPEMKKPPWYRRGPVIQHVEVLFARPDKSEPNGWRYEDRVDTGPDAAAGEELNSGELEWYGEDFDLIELGGEKAERIQRDIFGDRKA